MRRAGLSGAIVGLAVASVFGTATAQSLDDRLPPANPGIGALFSGFRGTLNAAQPAPQPSLAREAPRASHASAAAPTSAPVPMPRPVKRGVATPTRTVAAAAPTEPVAPRARQEELTASAYAGPTQGPASLFGWLAGNAAPPAAQSLFTPPAQEPPPPQAAAEPASESRPTPEPRPMQAVGRRGTVAPEMQALVTAKALKHGVPVALAHAVVRIESNYNPRAVGGRALGLMQIKYATARGIGFNGSAEELMQPATNLEWGMRYLAGAHKLARGDVCGTVMRYQSGHRAERMNGANLAYCTRARRLIASHTDNTEPARTASSQRRARLGLDVRAQRPHP